jgi:hypothetical protein
VADVLVIGAEVPALDAASALGLGVSRSLDSASARADLGGLRQAAVVVLRHPATELLVAISGVRRARSQLRTILLVDDPTLPCPEGVDEQLDGALPDDEIVARVVIHLAHARASAPRRLPVADDTVLDLDARALRRRVGSSISARSSRGSWRSSPGRRVDP